MLDENFIVGCGNNSLKILNINTKIGSYFYTSNHDYGKFEIRLFAYETEWIDGKIKLSDHDDVKWINKDDFYNYQLAPADLPIKNKILNLI